MFGFIAADPSGLSEEQLARYKGCYCGVCRQLKERHGGLSRLTLTYDMTFLVILLSSLYEPEEKTSENRCVVHPFKPRRWWSDDFSGYAADMTVLLAYLKCRDDWDDDCDPIKKAEASLLRKAYLESCKRYPRQSSVINAKMEELSEMERRHITDPDAASRLFGELMGEIFVCREDRWSEILRSMGAALGKFIYIMDAVVDRDKDMKMCAYNVLENMPDTTGDHYRAILDMLMGECVFYFDKLPLVQDAGILKNILCVGVWTVYMNKFYPQKKGDESDNSGSV